MNLRDFARGQDCQLRIPGVCNFNAETTMLCHIKRGWFGSLKPPDICAVWGCSNCHDLIDGRRHLKAWTREALNTAILEALCRQLRAYADRGILDVRFP